MMVLAATLGTPRAPGARMTPRRRLAWCTVVAGVLVAHGGLKLWLDEALVGWGMGDKPVPPRMEVSFVRALAPAAPPSVAPRPAARAARAAPPIAQAASAPDAGAALPAAQPLPAAATPAVEPPAVTTAPDVAAPPLPPPPEPAVAAAPTVAASAPAAAPAFEWPPSTRVTYTLTGHYRGEVHGGARVQWIRQGSRYQVHLDVTVGPGFAPLMSRRMTSDGEIGPEGLVPRRYDEETRLPFRASRRVTVEFAPTTVTLANGSQRDSLAGVQDTASQFVHLTWLFTTRPELLKVGNAVMVPLALPRRVDRWVYDVVGEERLATPAGALDTFHLRPRRAEDRPRGELSAEVWFAPALQYLPVRLRIQQDAETYVDLLIDAAPMQAEPAR
ncbi:MAG TPA: DUF3108 domain-containing protein [Burkholderiaceae bacterium]|nr:DUF3108 domain-containing protein [Burkholderiaceae bacterium]